MWDTAVTSITTALEYTPRAADLYYLRGDAYTRLGETDKAIADFNEALRFNPEFEAARAALEKVGEQ
jgi:tetratricopeptide (TPR) repeat protein